MEFKKGDRVRVIKWVPDEDIDKNKTYTLTLQEGLLGIIDDVGQFRLFSENWGDEIKLVSEKPLSQYQSLKSRIEAINQNTTVKEYDDIFTEITSGKAATLEICHFHYLDNYFGNDKSCPHIKVYFDSNQKEPQNKFKEFEFHNQCEKGEAYKKALLWLLDHSDIKKDDHSAEIAELKKQMEEINEKIKELESEA